MAFQALKRWLSPILDPLSCLDLPSQRQAIFQEDPASFLKHLEWELRHPLNEHTTGEYRSGLRGHGLDFDALREYIPGDDIRKIDWNVFARTFHPHIREYQEEKLLTAWLIVDLTPSMFFGHTLSKAEAALRITGLLSLLIQKDGHRLGLCRYTGIPDENGQTLRLIQPKGGNLHIQHLMKDLLGTCRTHAGRAYPTQPDLLARHWEEFSNIVQKRSLCFFISDFLSPRFDWENTLGELARKSTLYHFLIEDPTELAPPEKVGLIDVFDPERLTTALIDTDDPGFLASYQQAVSAERERRLKLLHATGKTLVVQPETPSSDVLYRLFRKVG